jgi:hypothetical protein
MTWDSKQNGVFADFGSFFASEPGADPVPSLGPRHATKAFRAIR